jgi:DNA-directed RNA polymerase specialized sigma24 family protein
MHLWRYGSGLKLCNRKRAPLSERIAERLPVRAESPEQQLLTDFPDPLLLIPAEHREIARLHFYEGETLQQIADRLGCTRQNVSLRLLAGLRLARERAMRLQMGEDKHHVIM